MYYILRYGYDGKPIREREYHNQDKARRGFCLISNLYERLHDDGLIHHYTCLLLTKGVRLNEETKGTEHRDRESQGN